MHANRQWPSLLPGGVALLIALLSGIVLFNYTIFDSLLTIIVESGLDPLRAQLVVALLLTTVASLSGAMGGRRKTGAMLGSGAIFCFAYLLDFIQQELQPMRDPGGNLESLNGEALLHTSLVILALAVLAAFIGAATGAALGEVLFEPPSRFVWRIWQSIKATPVRDIPGRTRPKSLELSTLNEKAGKGSIAYWAGTAVIIVAIVLAAYSGDLFLYSPDIGLHTLPIIPSRGGLPVHGTLVEDSIISPALKGQKKPFLVYLPPSYYTALGKMKRYPTLYLLHGSPGGDRDWFTAGKAGQVADTLIALGKIPELILILPDGNGRRGQTSEWGNSFDRRQNIETFVSSDLVRYVDAKYRTIAQAADRGIGGLSMGGFGAMNIAIHHPLTFGFVIALGGYYRAEGSIWGRNAAYMRENSPIDVIPLARPAWHLHIYLGAATNDQPYYSDTMQFAQELDHLHLPHQLDIEDGFHSWKVWQTQIYHALAWLHWGSPLS